MRTTLYAGIAFALLAGQANAGSFTDLGIANGQMTSLSHNGRIAAGIAGESGWRWAKDRGPSVLTGFVEVEGMTSDTVRSATSIAPSTIDSVSLDSRPLAWAWRSSSMSSSRLCGSPESAWVMRSNHDRGGVLGGSSLIACRCEPLRAGRQCSKSAETARLQRGEAGASD